MKNIINTAAKKVSLRRTIEILSEAQVKKLELYGKIDAEMDEFIREENARTQELIDEARAELKSL